MLGASWIQLANLDEQTARDQRLAVTERILPSLVAFDDAISSATPRGSTNLSAFEAQTEQSVQWLQGMTLRAGMYVDVQRPATVPHERVVAVCPSYTHVVDGVVFARTWKTADTSIVGAFFDVLILDGRQTLHLDRYVPVAQCLEAPRRTPPERAEVFEGALHMFPLIEQPDGAGAQLAEALVSTNGYPLTAVWHDLEGDLWRDAHGVRAAAPPLATYGYNTAAGTDDGISWSISADGQLQHVDDMAALSVFVNATHVPGLANDDRLRLRIHDDGQILHDLEIGPLGTALTYGFSDLTSPTGQAYWTAAQLKEWEYVLYVEEVGAPDPLRVFVVDHIRIELGGHRPDNWRLDVGFPFPQVPVPYSHHTVELDYRFTQTGPTPDTFSVQVWTDSDGDGTFGGPGDVWVTKAVLDRTQGDWTTVTFPLADAELDDGRAYVRILDDQSVNDRKTVGTSDQDVLELDRLEVLSDFGP